MAAGSFVAVAEMEGRCWMAATTADDPSVAVHLAGCLARSAAVRLAVVREADGSSAVVAAAAAADSFAAD